MQRLGTAEKKPDLLLMSPELEKVQDLMPMSPEDLQRLKDDIKQNGIRHPLICYNLDGKYFILAGWHRRQIAIELNIELIPIEIIEATPEERQQFCIKENLSRRHLGIKEKEALIINYPGTIKEKAELFGLSTRQIKRYNQLAKEAKQKAKEKGKPAPDRKDFEEARKKKNLERKKKGDTVSPPAAIPHPLDAGTYELTEAGYKKAPLASGIAPGEAERSYIVPTLDEHSIIKIIQNYKGSQKIAIAALEHYVYSLDKYEREIAVKKIINTLKRSL